MRPVRRSRLLVAATLILASGLLGMFRHRHPAATVDVLSVSGDGAHAPQQDPCVEPGALAHTHAGCAVCVFQRLLSGSRVTVHLYSAPLFAPARIAALPRTAVTLERAVFTDPRGPPAV